MDVHQTNEVRTTSPANQESMVEAPIMDRDCTAMDRSVDYVSRLAFALGRLVPRVLGAAHLKEVGICS